MEEKRATNKAELTQALLQFVGLLLTSYPLVAPLLDQLRENAREALDKAADLLPRVNSVLRELEMDPDLRSQVVTRLLEAVPELAKLFQQAGEE